MLTKVSDSSCKFLLSTIEDVFDLSKIELNRFSLNFGWMTVEEVFYETEAIMKVQF